jgi:mono/diheme cytochrome c family protein
MRQLLLAVALLAASTASGWSVEPGNPQLGAAQAETWCASCHLIGTDETQTALVDVPPFTEVAKTLDEARREDLALWLTGPHASMPDLSLTQQEIADLLAYIETLAP